MRTAGRIALLVLIAGLIGYVAYTYRQRVEVQKRNTASAPEALPSTLNSKARDFVYATSDGSRTVAELRAKDYREIKDPPHMELEQMELRLFHPDGKTFDLVKAAKGDYYPKDGRLSSQDEVEVQLALPAEKKGGGRLLGIKAKGASLEIQTGKVFTEGAVEFRFQQTGGEGSGSAVGAEYDPQTHELHLMHQAVLRWKASDPAQPQIQVESEDVRYKELESKVYFSPWAKMQKAGFEMASAESEVKLEEGVIRHVLAKAAKGKQVTKLREVDYSAQTLNIDFSATGSADKVLAEDDAKLSTRSSTGRMNASARRMDLNFVTVGKDSLLQKASANGKAVMESIPLASETKILRSDAIDMKMRAGGEEIESVETHAPGSIDFVPNKAGQRRRHLDGERMWISYGANNQIEQFRSVSVETRTEPASTAPKTAKPVLTSSKDMDARFDPKTGEMLRMEQWNDFRYQEGDKRAKAERASLVQASNLMELKGKARVWDPTGSTDADEIELNQKTGDFIATGNVRSTREPEKKPKDAASKPETTTQATADKMQVSDSNTKIRYEGNAVMWQGESRLRAQRIEIDRKAGQLRAFTGVVHQMVDEKAKANAAPLLTTVKSNEMFYADKDRVVEYLGVVQMLRPGLLVNANRLRAYLAEEDSQTSNEQPGGGVEKVFAYGAVQITETGSERVRRGKGEIGEFYAADGRLLLEGGKPEMFDTVKGVEQRRTTGRQLQWFANNDKMIVDGLEQKPAVSDLQRKRKR
jgi:lipopolysaccharide export system protein LptA